MTHLAIEYALLAVIAADAGDELTATGHISRATQETRATARRDRQVVEIAALVVAGERDRAVGLALEHVVDFPEDAELLACVAVIPGSGAAEVGLRGAPPPTVSPLATRNGGQRP